jgi:hypothetical protein
VSAPPYVARREPTLREACRVVLGNGYTPVETVNYRRLRAWLDLNGWPPKDWQPPTTDGVEHDA